jgi:glycine/D-amino acid oxidase-like deaminating enzyme
MAVRHAVSPQGIGARALLPGCAYFAARAGLSVTMIERGSVGSGTTSSREGNILVSDKAPGPELDLGLWSLRLWQEIGADLGADRIELEDKGGLVVATNAVESLHRFAAAQEAAGVTAVRVQPTGCATSSRTWPTICPVACTIRRTCRCNPSSPTAALVQGAHEHNTRVVYDAEVSGSSATLAARRPRCGSATAAFLRAPVVNATGTWGGELSKKFGAPVPVLPRKGYVLVTEPMPRVVRHKVYTADYIDNVASSAAELETWPWWKVPVAAPYSSAPAVNASASTPACP